MPADLPGKPELHETGQPLTPQERWNRSEHGKEMIRKAAQAPHRKAAKRAWAVANRDRVLASQRRFQTKKKAKVIAKKAEGCVDCGEKDVLVIQLHAPEGHLTPKGCIGDGSRFNFAELEAELAVVIPLCANCHLRRHRS